jgi:hypothetical protein
MEVLRIVIAKAGVLDTRTLAALETCCKTLAADALWRRERMARAYAEVAHGRWPSEIVGPPPKGGLTTWRVDALWLDEYDKRRLPRDPDTFMYFVEPVRVLALLKHVRDPCPKRERRRRCDAVRPNEFECDLAWNEASSDYIESGFGSLELVREAYRLWEPYYALPPEDRVHIGSRSSHRSSSFVPPAGDLRAIVSERCAHMEWVKSLGEARIAVKRFLPYFRVSELDKIVIEARVDRERALTAAMRARNINLRNDSEVVKEHVMTGEHTITEVCDIAEEMEWYFQRGYGAVIKRFPLPNRWEVPHYERDFVLKRERMAASEGAKDVVVRSKLSYTDGVMPDNLPERVAARFQRIMAEPEFESRSPWDE